MTQPTRYVLSGCSGGGKSTVLNALRRRGFQTFEEPGRQIVREEQAISGTASPWVNPEAFAAKAIEMSVAAFDAVASSDGTVFYDRCFIDAISYVSHLKGALSREHRRLIETKRFADQVFLTPPWPEIFENDAERQLGFDQAIKEYDRLRVCFGQYGYVPIILPKRPVEERVTFLLDRISEGGKTS